MVRSEIVNVPVSLGQYIGDRQALVLEIGR